VFAWVQADLKSKCALQRLEQPFVIQARAGVDLSYEDPSGIELSDGSSSQRGLADTRLAADNDDSCAFIKTTAQLPQCTLVPVAAIEKFGSGLSLNGGAAIPK